MLLKLSVPVADAAFEAGYVSAWHKSEGDAIGFGDDICDISIDEFMALQRTKRATLLGSTSKWPQRKVKDGYDRREGRGLVTIRLTSSETGVKVGKILVPVGGRIKIGTIIGTLIGGDDDGAADDTAAISAAPDARVVVNHPDAGDLDPFDDDITDD